MTRLFTIQLLAFALLLSGCKLTPDYERPDLGVPEAWRARAVEGESIANLPWWEIYDDETLTSLIERALEQNQDLAIAMARMQEADYLVTFTRAEQFPFLDVFGSADRGRPSRKAVPGASTTNNFALGANLSFEIDLWRRFARATEAARADLLATEAAYRTVTIGLVARVARDYLLLRDLDTREEIAIRTAGGRRRRLEIVRARFEKGTEARIDVNQAEVQLAIAEASIAQFRRRVAQTEHSLRVLLGSYPGPIPRGERFAFATWPIVPAGLPSDLLKRRPDVVEAEQRLMAETARVGVAQALRFPSLSLTAQLSAVADDLTDLNSTDAGQWNVMAGIAQPIFNSGRLKAQMKAQRARAEQAQHAYVGVVQNAFREVEDALVAIETFQNEHAARRRQVAAAASAARLSRARYDGGVVDYLEVLDSERSLFDAELAESSVRRQALTSLVDLYAALGGGWQDDEADDAPRSDRGDEGAGGPEDAEAEEAPEGAQADAPSAEAKAEADR